ncbi:zinc ribbon domain-containing protein [Bifidobacterium criceti]|uniref:Transcriptional regulator n=1 Tax=Bifidobacterium criceti TaxID=1960969 RepID=A0A2A2EHD4_9BIFI|nr:zinc ribbon domain-containing protein [Bifidobacterium criceti]PAU68392.1 transcriptional regulator [Bifidobacterium criceti]
MAQDNLYVMLDIFDFDDDLVGTADDDPRVRGIIDNAWTTKEAQWSKDKTKNARKASKASNYLEQAQKRRSELDTMQARRDAWDAAKRSIDAVINKQIGLFSMRGYLLTEELGKIAEIASKATGVNVPVGAVQSLVPSGIEVREHEGAQGKELPVPKDASKYSNTESLLETYHYEDLYALLDAPQQPEGMGRGLGGKITHQPAATLKAWAEADKHKLPTKSTTIVGDHNKLFQKCCDVFADEDSKRAYDEYLAYRALRKIIDEAAMVASVSKKLDSATVAGFVRKMQESASRLGRTLSAEDADAYLQYMCSQKGITYASSVSGGTNTAAAVQYEVCPWCGAFMDPGVKSCTECGGRIFITCPNCGSENRADVKYCAKCGFDYGNLRRAQQVVDEATGSIEALRFDEAEQLLDTAETLWKSMPEIAQRRTVLEARRTQIGPLSDQLHDAIEHHAFHTAKQLYEDIGRRAPDFTDAQLLERINAGIAAAETIMKQAGPTPGVDVALRVYEACADYPGLSAILAANPPKPAGAVHVRADGVRRANVVSWDASATADAVYKVIRKAGSRPLDEHDGDEVERTAGTSATDTTIEPNTVYYYAVIATLGPLSAAMSLAEPVVNYFDVKDPQLVAEDGAIRIAWSGVPKNADVEVWRATGTDAPARRPGEGDRVSNIIGGGLQDTGLRNGTAYQYTLFAVYMDADGQRRYSQGVCVGGIPLSPPEPIEFVIPQLMPDDTFTLQWDAPNDGESRFFLAREDVGYSLGDSVPLRELASSYDELHVVSTGPDSGTFTLPDDAVYHLIPATVKEDTAFIGAVSTVTKRKVVSIDKITDSSGDAVIMFDWPQADCVRVLLAWRTDHYASGPNERGSSRKMVNKKTYDLLKAIKVEGLANKTTYYFSLFAQLGEGDAISYSAPSNRSFSFGKSDTVTYRVETSTFLGRIRSAKLVVESTGDVPPSELRVSKDMVPAFATQGACVLEVPQQSGAGRHEFPLPPSVLRKGQCYKLFFKDDDDYNHVDLILQAGISPEIG